MKRLLHRQEGAALVMALAFLLLSVPLVIAALKLASTLALDSGTRTGIFKSQFATLVGWCFSAARWQCPGRYSGPPEADWSVSPGSIQHQGSEYP